MFFKWWDFKKHKNIKILRSVRIYAYWGNRNINNNAPRAYLRGGVETAQNYVNLLRRGD